MNNLNILAMNNFNNALPNTVVVYLGGAEFILIMQSKSNYFSFPNLI